MWLGGLRLPLWKPRGNLTRKLGGQENRVLQLQSLPNTHRALQRIGLPQAPPTALSDDAPPTTTTIHVPLFIWTSDIYKQTFPSIQRNLTNRLNARISASSTFHTFLELAQVRCAQWQSSQSFAGNEYLPGKRLVTDGDGAILDYDERVHW